MARTTRKSSGSKSGGSTFFGLLAGLIIGLAAAAAVAVFVVRAPMPFVDRASRDPAQTLLPDVKDAPDPNIGLYGKDGAAGVAPTGPMNTTPLPLPDNTPQVAKPAAPRDNDNISKLIATLTDSSKAPAAKAPAPHAPASPPPSGGRAPAAAEKAPPAAKASAPANTQTVYYLQAGAFRSNNDAEAVKAQILLLGLPAEVQKAQVNGSTINRVRVGPFKGIDEMNRSRARLGEEKIASAVVRQ